MAHAYDRLTKEGGFSDAGAKGLISRWANVESHGGPASRNPISGAFGIEQDLGSRKTGIDGNTNFDDQLSHTIEQANGPEKAAATALRRAITPEEAARAGTGWERAEGWNPHTSTDNFTGRTLSGYAGVDAAIKKARAGVLMKGTGTTPTTPGGASGAAVINNTTNGATSTQHQSSNEVHIGAVHVNAPRATDAKGIAESMADGLRKSLTGRTANFGLA